MDSKYVMITPILVWVLVMGFGNSDINKDREECATQLVGLATCLPYVGGDGKAPPPDCCTGLREVLKNSKKCLCILIKDRNDPSLGLKINATLALGLPTACNSPANISDCPSLLNLAPNSTDAKVFEDFANSSKGSNTTTATTTTTPPSTGTSTGKGSTGSIKSEGGKGKRLLVVDQMVFVVISSIVLHIYIC